ncbi:TPA: bifunctional riboflavin kinase/FAD synthetase [Candidatus Scatousia excrementigallinarum]|uniref:Riboflavin biosynthesis protein n=1 Tax=Candidatus Scatousia excrementigallinarum TaxID=2840935 RepID=A0A9D1EX10_9BACT|nr:bifunctional riboflavin kinase/FAD synthetase [Candidatus Scatousia excrementigallinarum]
MQIFTELNKNPDLSLALGYFDGVHKGHQKVIKTAVQFARQNGNRSAVITFKDHPCCFFRGVCPKYILTGEDRLKHIEALGIDYVYILDFNAKLCMLSAGDYLKNILIDNFSPKSISTGFNHYFGSKKSGGVDLLTKMQSQYGYKYFEVPPQKLLNDTISSTEIRKLLSEGNIKNANEMLGYNFTISGEVVKGQQLGRKIGFRTANLMYPPELIDLPFGVYSVVLHYNGKNYKGITNFGIRPTVSNNYQCSLETHILDFDKDIYGEEISVEFLKMIRAEKKFDSIHELKEQISKDIRQI